MEDIKFNSLEELYNKLIPALDTKVNELRLNGITYINNEDIWNYLRINKWSKCHNLTLSKCVDDILNTSDNEYKNYSRGKLLNRLGDK